MKKTNAAWRVVMFTIGPMAVPNFEARLNAPGYRLVGVVTAPGRAAGEPTATSKLPNTPGRAST